MVIITAIVQGIKQTWQYKRIVALLYLMTFLLAAFIAHPLKNLLEAKAGHSMMVRDLLKGFDYTFLNDFNNAYGVGFLPIIDQSLMVLTLYLLLFVFLTGGIVATFLQQPERYNRAIFWGQSAVYFWRVLRLTVYFLIIHSIVFFIFGYIFYKSVSGLSPFELENEATISFAFKIIAPTYILVAAFFFMWQDYTKIILVKTDKPWIFQSLWLSLQYFRRHFFHSYGLYILNLLLWSFVILLNYWISNLVEFKTSSSIINAFIISQLFVFARLTLKLINLSSISFIYKKSVDLPIQE